MVQYIPAIWRNFTKSDVLCFDLCSFGFPLCVLEQVMWPGTPLPLTSTCFESPLKLCLSWIFLLFISWVAHGFLYHLFKWDMTQRSKWTFSFLNIWLFPTYFLPISCPSCKYVCSMAHRLCWSWQTLSLSDFFPSDFFHKTGDVFQMCFRLG